MAAALLFLVSIVGEIHLFENTLDLWCTDLLDCRNPDLVPGSTPHGVPRAWEQETESGLTRLSFLYILGELDLVFRVYGEAIRLLHI